MMTDLHESTRAPEAERRSRRPLLLAATVVALVGALVAGFAVAGSAGGGRKTAGEPADRALNPSTQGDLAATIAALQATLKTTPGNDAAWATLGLDYVDQARVTVNPAFDTLAEGALRKSLAINHTDNFIADAGMASLAAARHQFAAAKAWALKGLAVDGYNAALYGTLADARDAAGGVRERSGLRTEDDQPAAADPGAVPCLLRRRAGGQPAECCRADDAGA